MPPKYPEYSEDIKKEFGPFNERPQLPPTTLANDWWPTATDANGKTYIETLQEKIGKRIYLSLYKIEVKSRNEKDEYETMAEATFKAMVNIDGIFVGEQEKFFSLCKKEFITALKNYTATFDHAEMRADQEKVPDLKDRRVPVPLPLIDELYQSINSYITIEYMEYEGRNPSGNILLWIHHVMREMVLRFPADSKKDPEILSPMGNIKVTRPELIKRGFGPILTLLDKMRNPKLIEKVYNERMYERFHRCGLWNKDASGKTTYMDPRVKKDMETTINVIMNELAFDMVRGNGFFTSKCMMYVMRKKGPVIRWDNTARKNVIEKYWGPGVWIGEFGLRELAEAETHPILQKHHRPNNVEMFTEIAIEEVQHLLYPDAYMHDLLAKLPEGGTNYGQIVEHDTEGTQAVYEFVHAAEVKHGIKNGQRMRSIRSKIYRDIGLREKERQKQQDLLKTGSKKVTPLVELDWTGLIKDVQPRLTKRTERTRRNNTLALLRSA